MKSMKITESDKLYVIETSGGARGSGASVRSAASKLLPPRYDADKLSTGDILTVVFDAIPNAQGGQIRQGVASA